MIIAVVRFQLSTPLTLAEATKAFAGSAAAYQVVPGLRHKHFLISDDGTAAGGVYEWDSRGAAQAMYTDEWRARIAAKYGAEPVVEYFTSPVQVGPNSINVEPIDSPTGWVAEHTRQYLATGGDDGHDWRDGYPTLLLTTIGRRSGIPRRTALIYGVDGDDLILVASYGGRPDHPLWYTNLVDHPAVTIQVRDQVFAATATTVTDPAERARLWAQMAAVFPPYDDYQAKTERQIPLVRVTRA
jgi:deazaflavin-dependent oxidoreductase (nitroreductase family)